MKGFSDLSIANKLMSVILGVCLVILMLVGVARIAWDYHQARDTMVSELSALTQLIANRSSAALAFDDGDLARENLNSLQSLINVVNACVYRGDGSVLAQYWRASRSENRCPDAAWVQGLEHEFGDGVLHAGSAIRQGALTFGWVYLASDFSHIDTHLRNDALFMLSAVLAAGLLALWLAGRVQRLISEPIEAITRTAHAIEEGGEQGLRAPVTGNDEVADLARKFNAMLEALDSKNQQLRRSQKMEAMGKLTGGIAHDYNNMLGVVLGYAELLEELLDDRPDLARYASEIHRAGSRGAKLTQKLLSFSRARTTDAEEVNINRLLLDEQHMLEKTLTARILMDYDLAPTLWPVWVDASDLEDVILNMCINAMHAMEAGGTISIQTRNVHISKMDANSMGIEMPPGDCVVLTITDTGHGMDAETCERIFDPFFSTKGEKGTGLGLSQVYGFVQASGGAIKVYSELDHGTRFSLYFPRNQESQVTTEARDAAAGPTEGAETILVVDDEAALRLLTDRILTKHGYRVLMAEDAETALETLSVEKVDLMLSDVIMPGMDGYALAAKVRVLYPETKICLASGFTDNRQQNEALDGEPIPLIEKPFAARELLVSIRKALDH